MAGETGRFEAFYASSWHHPIALWLAALAAAAYCLARRDLDPSVRRYALALAALSILDAWLTASPVLGLGELPPPLATIVPLAFVLAGDFRYLLLWEAAAPEGAIALTPFGVARAVGLTLIVPVFAQLAAARFDDPRALFLVYELAFCALTAALLRWHPNARALPWVCAVSYFVLLYYGLWACADVLLLATGSDLGYALRGIPNLLYYGGFIAAVARLAPRSG
jgi:hypothetical protein